MTDDFQELLADFDEHVWFLPARALFDKKLHRGAHLRVLAAITNLENDDGSVNGNRSRAAQMELMAIQSPTFSPAGFWTNGSAQFLKAAMKDESLGKDDFIVLALLDRWRVTPPPKLSQLARACGRSEGVIRKMVERLTSAGFIGPDGFPETSGLISREPPQPEIPQ